jgi:hypothetical protein
VLAAALLLAAPAARARPVLVEMFVSQSCSSCLPANALLQQLAASDKNLLPLSLNVTYWNNTGWHDPDSIDAATTRQFWYAQLANSSNVYTPEAVVDGTNHFVGSRAAQLRDAVRDAQAAMAAAVPVTVAGNKILSLEVGQGSGAGQVILFGYDSRHATPVQSGENGGAVVTEINVVRSITALGPWNGMDQRYTIPRPAGQHVALLLQAADGTVLGLAAL